MARILIIDDHEDTAELLVKLFRRRAHEARALNDPTAAMALVTEFDPDLIVLDLMMPTMDGEDVLKCIREVERLKGIPVVIYSGDFNNRREARCRDLGALDYIVKGTVSFEELLGRISRFLPPA